MISLPVLCNILVPDNVLWPGFAPNHFVSRRQNRAMIHCHDIVTRNGSECLGNTLTVRDVKKLEKAKTAHLSAFFPEQHCRCLNGLESIKRNYHMDCASR